MSQSNRIAWGLAVTVTVANWLAFHSAAYSNEQSQPQKLAVQSIDIVGQDGVSRAFLGVVDGRVQLVMKTKDGNQAALLGEIETSVALHLSAGARIGLSVNEKGAAGDFFRPAAGDVPPGDSAVSIACRQSSTAIKVRDGNERARIALASTPMGTGLLLLDEDGKSRLAVSEFQGEYELAALNVDGTKTWSSTQQKGK